LDRFMVEHYHMIAAVDSTHASDREYIIRYPCILLLIRTETVLIAAVDSTLASDREYIIRGFRVQGLGFRV
jgi:hypothetical protein